MPISLLLGSPELPVRASFAHVFKPSKLPGQPDTELKFSIQALIPKSDPNFIPTYQAAMQQAYEEAVADKKKWNGMRPDWNALAVPLKDGDNPAVNKGKTEYMGHWVFSANTKPEYPPQVFNQSNVQLTSDAQFYSGCYCMVAGALMGYNFAGKLGIKMLLNGCLFIKDGEKFSGMESAESAFSGFMKPAGFNALAMPGANPMAVPGLPASAPPMPAVTAPIAPGVNPMALPPVQTQPLPAQHPQPQQPVLVPQPQVQPVNPMAMPFTQSGPLPPPYPQQ